MEILVFSGVRGHPCESATLLRYLTEMPQKEDLTFSLASVSSVPGWLSLGIIRSPCDGETGNCLAWFRVEQNSLQASLCRNVFRGTLEWASREGRSFTFVCRKKKNIFSVEKNFYLDFPSFPECIHCRLQTNGRCLGRQIVWSDIAQWNHMVSPVILIIHFCELHNFNIFTSQKAMSMKFSMGHPPSFSVHKLSSKRWFLSCIHSMSKFRLISLRNTYC